MTNEPRIKARHAELALTAKEARKAVLHMMHGTRSPHIGPCFSCIEIIVALYFRHLNASPEKAHDPDRDRFILSKGHAAPALYAILAKRGFIKDSELQGFAKNNGTLEQHPNLSIKNGIELSTGSLGHGLSVGAGMALSAKADKKDFKAYVLMGDGELNEGSVWEAVMFAGQHRLNNLVALIDKNNMQALGDTEEIIGLGPIGEKLKNFGWHVQTIDGHDFSAIEGALSSLSNEKPNAMVLDTIKGKGVSFMEHSLKWHYHAPDDAEFEQALREL